jgi:hypothetical protein
MRTAILRLLQDRMASGNDISQQDIFDCIGVACEMLEIEIESRVALPQPDTKTIEAAQEAAREGRGSTIDEILNGLS